MPQGSFCLEARPAPDISIEERREVISEKIKDLNLEPELSEILLRNFNVFSANKYDSGSIKEPIDFEIKPDFHKNYRPYALNQERREFLDKTLDTLLFHKQIGPCESQNFGSPVFVIPRKTLPGQKRTFRLIIDARKVAKSVSFGETCIMESCHDIIRQLAGCKYVSTVDLTKAFFALKVSQKVLKTGFQNIVTPKGVFRIFSALTGSTFAPWLLSNQLWKKINENLNGEFDPILTSIIKIFYDDCSIGTKEGLDDYQTHLQDLERLLQRIERTGLRISLDKCSFAIDIGKEDFKCLGFVIGKGTITPDPEKLAAVKELGEPRNLKQLQSLCGSLQYIRHLLPIKSGGLLTLLNDYASENKFKKDENFSNIFTELIGSLHDLSVQLPFQDSTLLLFSDSSAHSYGGVLLSVNNQVLYNNLKGSTLEEKEIDRVLQLWSLTLVAHTRSPFAGYACGVVHFGRSPE